MFNFLLRYWTENEWVTAEMVYGAVGNGNITEEQYQEIINTPKEG